MADLEVTLGARNEASDVLRKFQQDIQQTSQNIQFSFKGLTQLATVTAAVVGAVKAGEAIASFASSSIDAFDQVNKSAIKLAETLSVLPSGVNVSSDQLTKLAADLERVTNVDQSQIVNQMAGAARRGADPKQLDEMAEAAIGLSRVFDRDLATAMRFVEQATQGNFEAFRGLIPGIDALATEDEKLAAVSKLAQAGLENKAQAARSALESSEALTVAMKQLYQTVGALIVPIRDVVYKGFILISDFIVGTINPDLETFDDLVTRITETVSGLADMMLTGFVSAFTFAETVVTNFSTSVGIAVDYISLRVTTMVENVKYSFSTLATQIQAIATQPGRLIGIGVAEVTDRIVGLGEVGQKLRDEAKAAFLESITVPERQLTDTEKRLAESLNTRIDAFVGDYTAKLQQRLETINKDFKIPFDVNLGFNQRQQQQPAAQNIFRELQAFESRVMTRGAGQDPVDRIAENSEKTAKNTEQMLKAQGETNRILGVNVSPGDAQFVEIR